MRKGVLSWTVIATLCFVLEILVAQVGASPPIPIGDTQTTKIAGPLEVGAQFRVMYNNSNLPNGNFSTVTDANRYDFFRQRMRFNILVQPADNVGGFLQLEYRGGWGGSSPDASDPRGNNATDPAFNRLQARGVRYGYLWSTIAPAHTFLAGILPLSDQVGDTLFSADWDFNVGGVVLAGNVGETDYRFGFVQLVEGVSSNSATEDKDGDLYLLDLNTALGTFNLGGHLYYLNVDAAAPVAGGTRQTWAALTGSLELGSAKVNGFVMVNDGKAFESRDNNGWALKLEGVMPVGSAKVSILGLYTTGEPGDSTGTSTDEFVTIQEVVGSLGYWGYTHIFTANGPSDVNDLGLRIGGRRGDNGGATGRLTGLQTIQVKLDLPLSETVSLQSVLGWFKSSEDNVNGESDLGTEAALMLSWNVSKYVVFQPGFAYAWLGDAFDSLSGGTRTSADNLYEGFARFQLQF